MAKLPKRQRTCRTGITKIMIRLKARELAKQMNVADFGLVLQIHAPTQISLS